MFTFTANAAKDGVSQAGISKATALAKTVGSMYHLHVRAPVIYNFFWAKDTDIVLHFTMIGRRFSFAPNTRSTDNMPFENPRLLNTANC